MLTQLQQAPIEALKQHKYTIYGRVWCSQYATPYVMQSVRKEKLSIGLQNYYSNNPLLKALIETFDGELQNIPIKSLKFN